MSVKIKKSEFSKLYDLACSSWKDKFNEKFKYSLFSEDLEFEESFLDEMEKACNDKQLKVFKSIFKNYVKDDLFSIKTYSEVCKRLKIKELKEKDFNFTEEPKKILAFYKIKTLEKLFNGDWKADWDDISQYKYYPYFYKSSGGWSYYGRVYVGGGVGGFVGLVGCFKDSKIAEYVGKTFKDIYLDLM